MPVPCIILPFSTEQFQPENPDAINQRRKLFLCPKYTIMCTVPPTISATSKMGPVKDMAIFWWSKPLMPLRLVNSKPQPTDPKSDVAMNACQAHTSIRVQLDVHQ